MYSGLVTFQNLLTLDVMTVISSEQKYYLLFKGIYVGFFKSLELCYHLSN